MCSSSHAEVWKLTSKLLVDNVVADRYVVFVPRAEKDLFESITDSRIEVQAQEPLGQNFYAKLAEKISDAGNIDRFGWYLQQFYKIAALQNIDDDILVIWDADCVPVKPIEIIDSQNKIVFVNSSNELHRPYFENIKKLLGMERVQEFSFVIPSFPMRKKWISEFLDFIEIKHGMKWHEAIIDTTDFSIQSGFSETETMGTFIANRYPDDWTSRKGTWERYGRSRFGAPKKFDSQKMVAIGHDRNLEIVTFENWDRGIKRKIRLKISSSRWNKNVS
jgi:hypothetical protein